MGKLAAPPLELTLAEWNLAVEQQAAKIMAGEKVKQLSQMFDAPQYAQQFMELARKTGKCRDLRIRAKTVITDAEGQPVINKKTKAPRMGWTDYRPDIQPLKLARAEGFDFIPSSSASVSPRREIPSCNGAL